MSIRSGAGVSHSSYVPIRGLNPEANRKQKEHPEVEASSGNVFADLAFPNPDEALLKAQLAGQILQLARERKLTQVQVAGILGIDQPKVSHLFRGRLSGFSTDRLLRFVNALGQDVEIVIRPAKRKRATMRLVSQSHVSA